MIDPKVLAKLAAVTIPVVAKIAAEKTVKEALEDSISASIREASAILPKAEISAQLEKAAKNVENWSAPPALRSQSLSGSERISQSPVRPIDIPITTPSSSLPTVKLPSVKAANIQDWFISMAQKRKNALADTGILNDSVIEPKPIETHDIEANWYEKEPLVAAKSAIETLAAEQNKRYNVPDTGKPDIETAEIYDDWYKETAKPLVEWPEDYPPEPTQAVQPTSTQLPLINSSLMMATAQRSSNLAGTGVRSYNESQGNTVDWKAGATPGTSTITISSEGKYLETLKEGTHYYIDSNGTAQYYNQPGISVRDTYGDDLKWVPGADGGASGSKIVTPDGTLAEGKDYYVGNDGRAYFYNDDLLRSSVKSSSERLVYDSTEAARVAPLINVVPPPSNSYVTMAAAPLNNIQAGIGVRTFNESLGNTVEWQAGATPGTSTITITSGGKTSTTLKEGQHYYIDSNGTARYKKQPAAASVVTKPESGLENYVQKSSVSNNVRGETNRDYGKEYTVKSDSMPNEKSTGSGFGGFGTDGRTSSGSSRSGTYSGGGGYTIPGSGGGRSGRDSSDEIKKNSVFTTKSETVTGWDAAWETVKLLGSTASNGIATVAIGGMIVKVSAGTGGLGAVAAAAMVPELLVTAGKTGYDATQTIAAIAYMIDNGGFTVETTTFTVVDGTKLDELINVVVIKPLN